MGKQVTPSGSSRLDRALILARDELFSTNNGARPARANVLVVVQSGAPDDVRGADNPYSVAEHMRKNGFNIIGTCIPTCLYKLNYFS